MGVPYQPFVEALRHYVTHVKAPRLGRHRGELARLVPELSEIVPDLAEPLRSDPETERYRLFDALAGWLADVSAETPVLLVLDDLHWAAKPTLLLVRHVIRFAEPLRLMVVGTYRDSEVDRSHPLAELLADLRRIEGFERLPLGGLDQAAVVAFIEAAAGHSLAAGDEAFSSAVWAETEGNPFFVAEVLRHLSETGGVQYRGDRWVITAPVEELGIPEGVRDVVGQRLSRLSEDANRALRVASVVGLEFDGTVVRAAGDFGEDALIAVLDEAVAASLVTEVPGGLRYRFGHALVRATLYDELSAARRMSLHRRVAEALEAGNAGDLDSQLPALAQHWARASAPGTEMAQAVDYATRAGDRALALLAHDEAATYYRQALDLLEGAGRDKDARRLDLLIALGEAQRRAGDAVFRETLLTAFGLAQERGDAERMAGRPGQQPGDVQRSRHGRHRAGGDAAVRPRGHRLGRSRAAGPPHGAPRCRTHVVG
jgi:predicted ATPase